MSNPTLKTCIKHAVKAQADIDKHDKAIEAAEKGKETVISKLRTEFFNASKRYGVDHETFKSDYRDAIKELRDEKVIEDVPNSVKQLVSDINCAMKLGLNPNDYESANAYRTAKIDANKPVKDTPKTAKSVSNGDDESETFIHPDLSDDLTNAISDLHKTLANLPVELQTDAAVAIAFTVDSLKAMIEDNKADTKAA